MSESKKPTETSDVKDVEDTEGSKDLGPPLQLEIDGKIVTGKVDRSKKAIILDDKIPELKESFLNHVSTDTYKVSRGDLPICIMHPGSQFANLSWCPEFINARPAIELKKNGMFNNLESLLHYKNNDHVPTDMVIAALECIRLHIKPSAIHMIDASPTQKHLCKIMFKR